jgi:hypothetical protein
MSTTRKFHDTAPCLLLLAPHLAFLLWWGKSSGYLFCFAIFFFYAWVAASFTIFPLPTKRLPIVCSTEVWSMNINLVPSLLRGQFHPTDLNVYGDFILGFPFVGDVHGTPRHCRQTYDSVSLRYARQRRQADPPAAMPRTHLSSNDTFRRAAYHARTLAVHDNRCELQADFVRLTTDARANRVVPRPSGQTAAAFL